MSEPAKAEPKLTGDALTIAFLKTNLAQLRTGGIVEVAMTNPNVMSYMEHWECRTEKAERALEAKDKLIAELVSGMTEMKEWVDRFLSNDEPASGVDLDHLSRSLEHSISKAKEQE